VALVVFAALLAGAPAARAELLLEWNAPASCPERSQVLDRIRALAGPAFEQAERLSVAGTITRQRRGFQLQLVMRDGREERRRVITSDSCAALAGAAAVTLALLMGTDTSSTESRASDPTAPEAERSGGDRGLDAPDRPDGEQSEPGREPAGSTPVLSRPAASTATASAPRWALLLRAPIMTADVGLLPSTAFGVGVAVGMRYSRWEVLLAAHLSREQRLGPLEADGTFGAELQRATGQLWACHAWRWSQFELAPCLGLGIEHVTVRGFGDGVAPRARRTVWPAPGAGAVARWHVTDILVPFAGANAHVELSRPLIVIEERGEVQRLGPAAAGVSLGVEWIL
jgi:hypothetical protein